MSINLQRVLVAVCAGLLSFSWGARIAASTPGKPIYDIVLSNGRVVDGSGTSLYVADVAVKDGRIAAIGRIDTATARHKIDAAGLVIAPGFIDMMGQTATPMLRDPQAAINLLTQGITTINAGEGVSAAPLDESTARSEGWSTMAEYFQLVDLQGVPVNVVQTVGHTQVRQIVLGDTDRRPNDEELQQMRELVREAMEAGAIGVSTALIYPPAIYATTEEIASLAEVAGEYGGRYYTHMRNEGDLLIEAIDEALSIGRKAKTPVHIFHLKTAGQQNWAKMQLAIASIKASRAEGHEVTADIYPYINNGLSLESFIHPRHFKHGRQRLLERLKEADFRAEIRAEMESTSGWENWFRHVGNDWSKVIIGQANDAKYTKLTGRSVAAIAGALGQEEWDTFFELAGDRAFALPESMTEANKILAAQQDFVSFCTDVGPAGGSRIATHPRAYGSFPRLLRRYVRELGVLTLERAVAQASAGAANKVLAHDRGRIAIGLAADLIVFDADEIADRATFAAPHELSVGMRHVLVSGVPVLKDGKITPARPGMVLRGPGYRRDKAPYAVSTGKLDPRLKHVDKMIRAFMKRHRIPGGAITVTDHGRLVMARGYGYADIAAKNQVTPESLFRIASISKPITATAILQLVEKGKLALKDRVFDLLDYEPHLEKEAKRDARYDDITIEQLLEHRGGWDRDVSFDAMFQSVRFANALKIPPPAQQQHVICCMLGQPLDFNPGERYAYSNFGYCLLGRLIEVVSKQGYEAYVKEHVFAPLEIESARLGKTRFARQPHDAEVRYYSPEILKSVFADDVNAMVPSAYGGWNLEAMDSHGGWTMSAVDLARFACAFDEQKNCVVLNEKSVARLFAPPKGLANYGIGGDPKAYYSCGWLNRPVEERDRPDSWHSGSLPGTATLLVRRHDGRNFVILFNARSSPEAAHFGKAIQDEFSKALDNIDEWPDVNLFEDY